MPRQIAERRQRGNQHVKTLARYDGTDRQQPYNAVPAACRQWRRIAARPCDGDALGRHAVFGSDQPCRGGACDDDALHRCKRGSLTAAQRVGLLCGQSRFQRERMMHQRQHWIATSKLRRRFGQDAKRQAIDDDGTAGRDRQQLRLRGHARRFAGPRKTFAEVEQVDLPAEIAEFGNHAPVIGVAAGRGRKIARHGERETPHHKSASYQARATCDSESVTRIALSSRPSRPNSPARAPLASWSKICLVRNSVVVLRALEFGHFVEIAIVQRRHHRLERVMRAADVDDDTVVIERLGDEGRVDDKGRAVQRLRWPEHGAAERMGDHDVIANFNGEQGSLLKGKQLVGKVCHSWRQEFRVAAAPDPETKPVVPAARRAVHRLARRVRQRAGGRGVQRGRCDGAICPTWLDISRSRRLWNATTKRCGHRCVAVPAHFKHGCLLAGERERRAKPGRIAAGVNHEVAVALGRFGPRKANPKGFAPIPRAPG